MLDDEGAARYDGARSWQTRRHPRPISSLFLRETEQSFFLRLDA